MWRLIFWAATLLGILVAFQFSYSPWKLRIIIPILQIKKLRINKVKKIVQNHTAHYCKAENLTLKTAIFIQHWWFPVCVHRGHYNIEGWILLVCAAPCTQPLSSRAPQCFSGLQGRVSADIFCVWHCFREDLYELNVPIALTGICLLLFKRRN